MTDGIIQKVFKKFHVNGGYGFEIEIDDNTVNVVPVAMVEEAFKELIEKIKQKFPEHKDNRKDTDHWNKCVNYVVTQIIGDN